MKLGSYLQGRVGSSCAASSDLMSVEQAALVLAWNAPEGGVFDIGVGTGRAISHLYPRRRRYFAIDFSPAMVGECRAPSPEINESVSDARHRRRLADDGFDVVLLSYSGIDFGEPWGRRRALVHVCWIQRAGCVFVSSTNVWLARGGQLLDLYAERVARMLIPAAMARRWGCCALRDARCKRNRQRLGASGFLTPHSGLVNDSRAAHTFIAVRNGSGHDEASLAKARFADVGVLVASGNDVEAPAAGPCLYDLGSHRIDTLQGTSDAGPARVDAFMTPPRVCSFPLQPCRCRR